MVAGELMRDEHAQLQTLEGFAAALLMVGTVYLVVTAVTMSVPQTELHVDAQLKTYGRDALAILDASLPPEEDGDYYTSLLKNSVVGWVNSVEGATSFETEEFTPKNSGGNNTTYKFKFRTPSGCLDNHTFEARIPNNTNISHAYVMLTGMPRLDTGVCDDPQIGEKLPLVLSNASFPDYFGCAIAHGDVNYDGVQDMVVGAYNFSSGAVYIYYGNNTGIVAWMNDGPNVTITNPGAPCDCFGWAVACGDVNGDNVSDVIVGAPNNNTTDTGMVYVYYGGATPSSHPDATIDNPRGTGKSGGWFGYSLACGDVNGGSVADLLIGAPGVEEYSVTNRGNAFVYYGPISGDYALNNESVKLHNPCNESGFFGISTACFNVNGDDFGDIMVGANHSNRTYIRFGAASIPASISEINHTLSGDSGSGFGISVSSAGDVNKDGADDLIVGASKNDSAYIFYGGSLLDNTSDINLTGPSGCGISVSASGDVDSDGYAGVIVGASSDGAGVFYDVDLEAGTILMLESTAAGGSVVAGIGDV
ncbi:MAG: integrin alpha, partial [Euryarchaeota archaeon]|nr:integrin alpha [Euryarchaeota archaeon]